uniref:Uncharacterized protein n=1 Tax=Vespula pensylvanica TaxID=30213 RepID=A0A834K814_VESPE|nr:hypothetical protein H0235_015209 [Vespula pensylvanica]
MTRKRARGDENAGRNKGGEKKRKEENIPPMGKKRGRDAGGDKEKEVKGVERDSSEMRKARKEAIELVVVSFSFYWRISRCN